MKIHLQTALGTLLVALSGTIAIAQDRGRGDGNRQNSQFTEHDQQVTRDWYKQNQSHPSAGFRTQDRLTPDEESRFHEGAVLDRHLRKKMHSAPPDLYRQLPPPPSQHRYVGIGNHVALIDNGYNVKAVVHLHDDHQSNH